MLYPYRVVYLLSNLGEKEVQHESWKIINQQRQHPNATVRKSRSQQINFEKANKDNI
jgi:hypothetical protein